MILLIFNEFWAIFWNNIWLGVCISLIVTGIVILLKQLIQFFKNLHNIKSHPIGKRFMSYYEDLENGKKVRKKAVINIKQKGKKFKGETYDLKKSRKWKIKGIILQKNFLTGSYQSSGQTDPGCGVFFLEPILPVNEIYSGYWIGFDSVNKIVEYSKYEWKKTLKIKIKKIKLKNDLAIYFSLSLLNDNLGKLYFNKDDIKCFAKGQQNRKILGAFYSKYLIGVVLFKILDSEEKNFYNSFSPQLNTKINFGDYKIGLIKSIAIRDDYKKKEVGSSLIKNVISKLKKNKCTAILGIAWDSNEFFINNGFRELGTIREYWKNESIEKQYECPKCGNPCLCSGTFVFKDII